MTCLDESCVQMVSTCESNRWWYPLVMSTKQLRARTGAAFGDVKDVDSGRTLDFFESPLCDHLLGVN